MTGLLRSLRSFVAAAVVAVSLAACDPAWFLLGTNDSDTTVLVRLTRPGRVEVYQLPAGFNGVVAGTIGTSIEADATILRTDCSVLDELGNLDQRVATIRIDQDLSVSVGPGEFPDDSAPFAEELRGECGSTQQPTSNQP